jgi:NADH-quinone oxidoreductase subunit N
MTAALLSLAGVPLTAGFVGKFYLVLAGIDATLWMLVFVLVVSSAIGLFYYLRIIVALYMQPAGATWRSRPLSFGGGATLAVVAVLLIGLGIYPDAFIKMIQAMVKF